MEYKRKWWRHSVTGVSLVGLGIVLIGEAIIIKGNPPPDVGLAHMATWFWIGFPGIAAVNAGICFIADAVKQRMYFEMDGQKSNP